MDNLKQNTLRLSLQDTNILKGIALAFLLWHHLFYTRKMPVDDIMIGHYPLVQTLGIWCKVCVAIFVFLSGYGLTVSAEKNGGIGSLWQFYKKRYLKLMINYWFIYLVFVPFGVLVMGRTLESVYGENYVLPAIVDFLGLFQSIYGSPYGYNPTWWFYGCIIVLYLFFPLLYKCKKYWYLLIPLAIVFNTLAFHITFINPCGGYMLSFVCGMSLALNPIKEMDGGAKNILWLFVVFSVIAWYRLHSTHVFLWDAMISLTLTILYMHLTLPEFIRKPLAFIGKHSFNIFLFHTFFFYLYFKEYIYWTKNPILIFATLFVVCMVTSMILEIIKEYLGINKLQKYLTK